VYTTRARAIDDLKIAIQKPVLAIPENTAGRTLGDLRTSLEECVRNNGQELSDVHAVQNEIKRDVMKSWGIKWHSVFINFVTIN
jgi:hypothetical protein